MRTAFMSQLGSLAAANPRVMLVVADLGYSVVEEFARRSPAQFVNAAVSEQSMTGMAAGLALGGSRIVFTYSIANFPTLRCIEQIRNDVCYHRANVKIVAVGGGLAYGTQGYTHFGIEDIAILRALGNMTVAAPADAAEARAVANAAAATSGPWYVRLGKNGEPRLHERDLVLPRGASVELLPGDQGAILATGSIAYEAREAARRLHADGITVRCVSMPYVKPIDEDAIAAAARTGLVITVEEHGGPGGFGSAVAEVLVDKGLPTRLHRMHLPPHIDEIGSQAYLRARCGIDADGIHAAARRLLASRPRPR